MAKPLVIRPEEVKKEKLGEMIEVLVERGILRRDESTGALLPSDFGGEMISLWERATDLFSARYRELNEKRLRFLKDPATQDEADGLMLEIFALEKLENIVSDYILAA